MSDPATNTSPSKGQRRDGDDNRRRGDNEEHKNDRYNRKPYNKDRVVVTLDTVIPDLPKKNELVAKPDDDVLQTELDKVAKEIDDIYKKIANVSEEARKGNAAPTDSPLDDLIQSLKQKQDSKKKAYDEFNAVVTERDMYRKQADEYTEKGAEYRYKMKIPGTKTDLERQLNDLKRTQSKGSISLAEEKKLIKEIAELEKSLPYAGPLEELEQQSREVKELLREAKKKTAEKFDVVKRIKDECAEIQDKINKFREEAEKKREETIPKIKNARDEFRTQIDNLKKKKRTLLDAHNENWRKYEDQQAEIERIKSLKRRHEKLVRDEARRKRDEERRKEREAAEQEAKEIPYRGQIELCELLIKYCNKLAPATGVAGIVENIVDKVQAVKEALQSGDWKSVKGEVLGSKRDKVDDLFTGKKKGKKPQKEKEQAPTNSNLPLNHQIETLNYFDEIKVSPPLFTEKLADTLKSLQEKKAYFEKLSQDALDAEESRKGMSEEERKRFDEEARQRQQEETQGTTTNKPHRRHNKTAKDINTENEQDFPTMK